MGRRVVVTGIGWITPLGFEIDSVWKRLLAGESGGARTEIFDAETFPTTFSAQVKGFDLRKFLSAVDYERHQHAARQAGFALAAARIAWDGSAIEKAAGLDKSRVGIYLGGGEGPIDFDNFVAAGVEGWSPEKNAVDTQRWA